ncbi:MAG: cell division protein SepF [Actinobacteria bacterium]|nr:MAG: cell division protein SepF [Actinomycetota bacterium]
MSSLFSKALVYLGLVDEDQGDYEPGEAPGAASATNDGPEARRVEPRRVDPFETERRVEPPPTARAANVAQRRDSASRVPSAGPMVRPVEIQSDVLLVEEFADARALADRIRDRTPVVLDMRGIDSSLVRRIVDFSSGLIYALDGSMRKVGDGLVLVLPPRVTLSRDERRRLASLGAYELDDIED